MTMHRLLNFRQLKEKFTERGLQNSLEFWCNYQVLATVGVYFSN